MSENIDDQYFQF